MTVNSKAVVATIRRDATYVRDAMVAVVFISFAGAAIGATIMDLMAIAN